MTKPEFVIIGAKGQLGYDLLRMKPRNLEGIGLGHDDIEIRDYAAVDRKLKEWKPRYVIDLAAYHRVDICEDQAALTFEVNALAAGNLARICREIGAVFVFASTDYVFSGLESSPRIETDATDPINVYGASKRAGESLVKNFCPESHVIFRVSGLYGVAGSSGKGGNFIETMVRLAREGKPIRVVNDQILTPTYTRELAAKIWEVIQKGAFGLFHCTSNGECSWFDFAKEIFRRMNLNPPLSPQSTAESGARATRPKYSVLDNRHLRDLGMDTMRPWPEALGDYLKEKKYI